MLIHNREIKFLLTTGAMMEIAEACPGGDLKNISEAMEGTAGSFKTIAKMAAAMSKWYEMTQAFSHGGYEGHPLTYEECLTLDPADFAQLTQEVMDAFTAGRDTVIETEPVKKKEE